MRVFKFPLSCFMDVFTKNMTRFIFGILLIKIVVALSKGSITVAFSERKPFVVNSNKFGTFNRDDHLQGLDISLIENFAKKCNIHIDYLAVNSSLNVILNDEKLSKLFIPTNLR